MRLHQTVVATDMTNEHHQHDLSSNRIGTVFILNLVFTLIEFVGGLLTNSTAIMADAIHDLGDTLSIGFAWLLNKLSQKQTDEEFTYGYFRFSLLAALINGLVLVIGSIWILSESIPRLTNPEMPHAAGMFWLAVLGVVVNGTAAWRLSAGKTQNERILNWHLLEDVLGWIAVLIVSICLMFFDWPILDPALSIAFTLFILINVLKNTYQTIKIFMQSVPDKKLLENIRRDLQSIEHVINTHHVHLWSLDGERHVLTAHLEIDEHMSSQEQAQIKQQVSRKLSKYSLSHTTIEIELPEELCRDS